MVQSFPDLQLKTEMIKCIRAPDFLEGRIHKITILSYGVSVWSNNYSPWYLLRPYKVVRPNDRDVDNRIRIDREE